MVQPRVLEVEELEFAGEDTDSEIAPISVVADDLSAAYRELRPHIGPDSVSDESVYGPSFSALNDLDIVTRAEVADHLRAAIPELGERPCARGADCEALKLPAAPPEKVILREHVSNARDRRGETNSPSLCILCKRVAANFFPIQDLAEGHLGPSTAMHHGNYFERQGEYSIEQALTGSGKSPLNVAVAVVAHCRACYNWVPAAGNIPGHFEETGYLFPEQVEQRDFGQRAVAARNC